VIDLNGRVALVTGASRGIGRATATVLAAQGAKVAVNYRANAEAADEVVQAIKAAGGEAMAIQADVRSPEEVQNLVKATVDAWGRLDILVNNAGTTRDALLIRMKEADWDLVLETDLKSVFLCTKAVQRQMMRQRYGRIISISSVSGVAGNAGQANYAAAKAGIIGFTKSVAKEVGSRSITVNAIAPGYVPTDLTADLPPDLIAAAIEGSPLKRQGTAKDIAYAVAFLASEEAGFITGQVLCVDGGLVI